MTLVSALGISWTVTQSWQTITGDIKEQTDLWHGGPPLWDTGLPPTTSSLVSPVCCSPAAGEWPVWSHLCMEILSNGKESRIKTKRKGASTREGLIEEEEEEEEKTMKWRKYGKNRSCSLETNDLPVRIKRGLVRDKEWDYNQTPLVVQLLVRRHSNIVTNSIKLNRMGRFKGLVHQEISIFGSIKDARFHCKLFKAEKHRK